MRSDTRIPRRPLGKARAEGAVGRRGLRALAALLLACAPLALPAQDVPPPARIGYVDMQRIIDGSPQFIAGREALQREFAQRDAALKLEETRLATLEANLRRDEPVLTREAAAARQQEVDALRRSIERTRTRLRDDLTKRRDEMLEEIWGGMNDVVIAYAREHRIDLVVQSPVIYASAAIDITDAVLERVKRAPLEPE